MDKQGQDTTPSDSRRLQGRQALVFGAGAAAAEGPGWSCGKRTETAWGVGKATAIVYARAGAVVTCIDKSIEAAQDTAARIRDEGGEAYALACDITQSAAVSAAVERHMARAGRVDILHNNIGIVATGGPVETSEEDFDRVIAANLKGMYLTCKYVLPIMERQGKGSIINISSIASVRFTVPWIAYNASKGAVNAMTMGIAAQYAPSGVRCNAIAPGLLSTPMVVAPHQKDHADFDHLMRARDSVVPMGWQGEGWDVGSAAVFLSSDEARFITGLVMMVDGGSSLCIPNTPWGRTAQSAQPA